MGLLTRSPGALPQGLGPLADRPGAAAAQLSQQKRTWSVLTAQTYEEGLCPQEAQWHVGGRAEAKGRCWQRGDLLPSHAAARTWENWPQSKGTLGGGDAAHDAVKQEADLLALGRGQEEDSSPCRGMDPSAWPGHRWVASLQGKATTPPARSGTQHLDEPLSPDNPACTSNTRLSRHIGHTPLVPHLRHQLGRATSMCGRDGVGEGVLPCWSHARTGAGASGGWRPWEETRASWMPGRAQQPSRLHISKLI